MRLNPVDVPVDPDADEAREWLLRELAGPEYQAAKPSWWDLLVESVIDWFASLQFEQGDGGFPWWILVLLVIVALVVGVAFVVYGAPRRNRRSRVTGALFGDDDERDASTMRAAAASAARAGDYATAIAELFRALARGLDERQLVTVFPGTTAHGFARAAAAVFADRSTELAASADDFDGVRYLGRPGTREQYRALEKLEAELRARRTERVGAPG